MSLEIKRAILDKIKEYQTIIITRHSRPDGDAVGASMGLKGIIKLSYPEKQVLVVNEDCSKSLAFFEKEDSADDSLYKDALMIVVDTATSDRISNKKVNLCKELIKIDHHIEVEHFGTLSWVESDSSSVSEMIADFFFTFENELKLNSEVASWIFTGMVTDSGRFRFSDVSPHTFEMASKLREFDFDTEKIYSSLYVMDFNEVKTNNELFKFVKLTENGVAYAYITGKIQKKYRLSNEQSGEVVELMREISGSLIWIVFIENSDKTIRARIRSRFVTINELAEKYGGGGHACACGATIKSEKDMDSMLSDADHLLKKYKADNPDCY